MSEPFTNKELEQRRENSGEILRPGFYYFGELQPKVIARELLRYHATLQAKDAQIERLVTALEKTRNPLRQAECYRDSIHAEMYGQALRRVEKTIEEATNE